MGAGGGVGAVVGGETSSVKPKLSMLLCCSCFSTLLSLLFASNPSLSALDLASGSLSRAAKMYFNVEFFPLPCSAVGRGLEILGERGVSRCVRASGPSLFFLPHLILSLEIVSNSSTEYALVSICSVCSFSPIITDRRGIKHLLNPDFEFNIFSFWWTSM